MLWARAGWRAGGDPIALADRLLRSVLAPRSPGHSSPHVYGDSAAALMRVNHSGEVCAQALYRSQAMLARSPAVREMLLKSGEDEGAHLRITGERLKTLGVSPSALDSIWFAGSFAIGLGASAVGDRFSLGFLEETEVQVANHLDGHLRALPPEDAGSRVAVRAMRADEIAHSLSASVAGGAEFPLPLRIAMRAMAKVMTVVAARV